uniref:Uncharacterized protein n=1 Tax=Pseudonaja textilis TaxID=8673 RepID=A0A670XS18_PSETE
EELLPCSLTPESPMLLQLLFPSRRRGLCTLPVRSLPRPFRRMRGTDCPRQLPFFWLCSPSLPLCVRLVVNLPLSHFLHPFSWMGWGGARRMPSATILHLLQVRKAPPCVALVLQSSWVTLGQSLNLSPAHLTGLLLLWLECPS